MASVYALVWSVDEETVYLYVGSSATPGARRLDHFKRMRNGGGVSWPVRRMVKDRGLPEWVILERIVGPSDPRVLVSRERYWIEYYVQRFGRSHVLNTEYVPAGSPRNVRLERLGDGLDGAYVTFG
jgi:hypothetical protein